MVVELDKKSGEYSPRSSIGSIKNVVEYNSDIDKDDDDDEEESKKYLENKDYWRLCIPFIKFVKRVLYFYYRNKLRICLRIMNHLLKFY